MAWSSRLEGAMSRMQRIVTIARRAPAPVTEHEAFEQIIEELELAGFGAAELDPELAGEHRKADGEHAAH